MMRFPNFRLGRSQYRQCSSMTEKGVPMGDFELFVDNMAGLFYKGAFVAFGIVIGGLTSSNVSEIALKDEEGIIKLEKDIDECELNMELMRKYNIEWNRRVLNRKIHGFDS